jgi:hypothetical protein
MLLRSYYFFNDFFKQCCEKALTDDSPYRLSGKNQGFAQVRGLQASA